MDGVDLVTPGAQNRRKGEPETATLKTEVLQNHTRSSWVSCGDEQDDSKLISTTKMTDESGIRTSELLAVINGQFI